MYDLAQFSQGRTPFYSGFRPKVGQPCCSQEFRFPSFRTSCTRGLLTSRGRLPMRIRSAGWICSGYFLLTRESGYGHGLAVPCNVNFPIYDRSPRPAPEIRFRSTLASLKISGDKSTFLMEIRLHDIIDSIEQ